MSAPILLLIPRTSEKTFALAQQKTYVFAVSPSASKHGIAKAVASQYKVSVESVNTNVTKGKVKQTVRKGGRPTKGQRKDLKKAYVKLAPGDKIAIFDEEPKQ